MNEIFIDVAVKSLFISGVLLALSLFLKRTSSSTRHLFLVAGIAGMLLLPILVLRAPKWETPAAWSLPATSSVPDRIVEASRPFTAKISPAISTASSNFLAVPWLGFVWLAGCTVFLLRVVTNLLGLVKLKRKCNPVRSQDLPESVTEMIGDRRVRVLKAKGHNVPVTWGTRTHIILLPEDVGSWPENRLVAVMRHELAHIDRRDWLTDLAANLACCVHWFNPAVWLMRRSLRNLGERAADDAVLATGCSAPEYAAHLVEVARTMKQGRPSAALAMASEGSVRGRVEAILASKLNRRRLSRPVAALLLLALLGGAATVATAKPGKSADQVRTLETSRRDVVAEREPSDSGPSVDTYVKELPPDDSVSESSSAVSGDPKDSAMDDPSEVETVQEAPEPAVRSTVRPSRKPKRSEEGSDLNSPGNSEVLTDAANFAASKMDEAFKIAAHVVSDKSSSVDEASASASTDDVRSTGAVVADDPPSPPDQDTDRPERPEPPEKPVKIGKSFPLKVLPEMNIAVPAVHISNKYVHIDMPVMHIHIPKIQFPDIRISVKTPPIPASNDRAKAPDRDGHE